MGSQDLERLILCLGQVNKLSLKTKGLVIRHSTIWLKKRTWLGKSTTLRSPINLVSSKSTMKMFVTFWLQPIPNAWMLSRMEEDSQQSQKQARLKLKVWRILYSALIQALLKGFLLQPSPTNIPLDLTPFCSWELKLKRQMETNAIQNCLS